MPRTPRLAVPFAALSILLSCAPAPQYYKAGETVVNRERAELDCKVQAARQVPVQTVTQVIPGQWLPPHKVCPTPTTCRMVPGRYLPPEFITEDANAELRTRVMRQCMADKGYGRVQLPPCPPAVAQAAAARPNAVLPVLQKNACTFRDADGVWRIVNPG
jgi:hypothetical protein